MLENKVLVTATNYITAWCSLPRAVFVVVNDYFSPQEIHVTLLIKVLFPSVRSTVTMKLSSVDSRRAF